MRPMSAHPVRRAPALLLAALLAAASAAAETARSGPSWDFSHGDLRVAANGRFLEHADGAPFFYLGDTAWELFHRLTRAEAEQYLENRRGKGFTVIQAVALAELDGLNTPNAHGDRPLRDNNPATPDTTTGSDPADAAQYDYWDHVDYIVGLAQARGIYLGILPTWGRWVNDGPLNASNARAYGRFIASRYATRPNIIWVLGGDRNAAGFETVWREMAAGIAEGDGGKHVVTFHPPGGNTSSAWFHNDAWLDFNMLQTGHGRDTDVWNRIQAVYNLSPVKPVMDGEPTYEDHPISFNPANGYAIDIDVRKYAYWDLFAGAHGHTYGCHNIWQMYAPGRTAVSWAHAYWYDSLDFAGAWDMMHVRNLLLSRPFFSRVPDQSLVADALSGGNRIQATRGDGYAFIYSASGQAFTVNLGTISGATLKAWWYNPRDGASTAAASDFANAGTRAFAPPSNGTGHDWVLVLDDASRAYAPPGGSTGNAYPSATITSPAPGASFSAPASIAIAATAADLDGTIARVAFYAGDAKIGEDATAPYQLTWTNVGVGNYTLTARAVDNQGAVGSSPPVSVLVRDPNSAFYRAINLNGPALAIDGNPWEGKDAPNYSYTGSAFESQGVTLSPATDANRTTMIRSSVWSAAGSNVTVTAVPNGTYEVFLYVWEDNASSTFDISLNGTVVKSGYASGAAGHWERLGPWLTTVADGAVRITCSPGDANLSGLEIWGSGGSTASPVVSVTASDADATEAGGTGAFTVSRTGATASALTVSVSCGGTATNGTDYASIGATVTLPAGASSVAVVVSPLQDAAVEGPETVQLAVTAGSGYAVGAPAQATVTIADDDSATPPPPPPSGSGTGLRGEYFDNMDHTALKLVRTDETVDFDWGDGAPDPALGADTFSVRWTGQVEARYSETHTFYARTDDGVRLRVNGQAIVDAWVDRGPTESSGTIALAAGQKADLVMEYYENGGGAVAQLSWSSASQSKQIVPKSQLYPATDGSTPPPTGVAATAGNREITVSWSPAAGATSFNLYLASVSGVTRALYGLLPDGRKLQDVTSPCTMGGLTNGKTCHVVVTAVYAAGESAESLEVSARPMGDWRIIDTDGDGHSDPAETAWGGNPADPGARPTDSDGDGLADGWETSRFGNLGQDGNGDPDGDGLPNLGEYNAQTDPNAADTDRDGYDDGTEVDAGSNPLDPTDTPDGYKAAGGGGDEDKGTGCFVAASAATLPAWPWLHLLLAAALAGWGRRG